MNLKSLSLSILVFLSVGVLVLWVWVKFQETHAIFHPQTLTEADQPTLPPRFEAVSFEGEAGRLSGIWYSGEPSNPLVIFFHGNAGHAFHRLDWMASVIPQDWNGFIFDYRGYGLSEGRPTEQGLYDDADSALQYVRERLEHDRVIFHARSLGVPIGAHAMGRHCPRGIIFESGFPSAVSMARTILPLPGLSMLLSVNFNAVQAVNQLSDPCKSVPKLIVHGRDDRVVPLSLGKDLHRQLPGPKQSHYFHGVGHNDVMGSNVEYVSTVRQFYRDSVEQGNGPTEK